MVENLNFERLLEDLRHELSSIRTGRATPALVENVLVEVYDTKMKLFELASITAPDSQSLAISPWDLGNLTPIRKTIETSNLGLNPTIDSANVIRIAIPPLTQERRQDLVKRVKQIVEEFKVRIRNKRQDVNKQIDNAEKNKEISEDEAKRNRELVQKRVDEITKQVEEIGESKELELMEV